jgi:quercetin dioxygenase-like cupin family protein
MATQKASPGDVIDVRPLGTALASSKTGKLFETAALDVVRLVLPAGKELKEHKAPGELIVQCLEGRIVFTALGRSAELTAGQLLFLAAGEPHAVRCIENASVLLTIVKAT